MQRNRFFRSVAFALCVAVLFSGCAHYKRPHLMVKVPDFYPQRTRLGPLILVTDPYWEASKIQYVFNTNLLEKGYLAVHFIAFNYGEKTYDLSRASFFLLRDDDVHLNPLEPAEVAKKVLRHTSLRMIGWGFAGLIILSIPFSVIAGIDSFRTNRQIRRAVKEDVMRVFEIGPKEVVDGFYFFRLGRKSREIESALEHQYQFMIQGLVDPETEAQYEFVIGLN